MVGWLEIRDSIVITGRNILKTRAWIGNILDVQVSNVLRRKSRKLS